jgi:hypothetical protein
MPGFSTAHAQTYLVRPINSAHFVALTVRSTSCRFTEMVRRLKGFSIGLQWRPSKENTRDEYQPASAQSSPQNHLSGGPFHSVAHFLARDYTQDPRYLIQHEIEFAIWPPNEKSIETHQQALAVFVRKLIKCTPPSVFRLKLGLAIGSTRGLSDSCISLHPLRSTQ